VLPQDEPTQLLELAWAAEPGLRLVERTAALDRLEALLDRAPDRRPELLAERAIDATRLAELDRALELAAQVLDDPGASELARARATEARGRALAWTGTDGSTHRAEPVLLEAADRYAALGRYEWQAYALLCLGNVVYLQNGQLTRARQSLELALGVLSADSPRRPMVLNFYADLLILLGEWHRAEEVLAEGELLARGADDSTGSAYAAWSRARMASARGDAMATERYVSETEREAPADWFEIHTGATFLAEAAELLDRVGLSDAAQQYLARAVERAPDDSFVRQARAVLLARSGDPVEALSALQELFGGRWIEKQLRWRYQLLTAWATLRAGSGDAGALAARALDLAAGTGGVHVAVAGEPDLVAALLPLAEAAGSAHARGLLLGDAELVVRLFGAPRFVRADGTEISLPAGQGGELVRMLALHPFGLPVEAVLDRFFPDVPAQAARHRLRQVLTKIRAAAGDVVLRQDDRLSLVPAWVDITAFLSAADRVRGARGARAVQLAYAALALWTAPPLPADVYADWAHPLHDQLRHRYLNLLDLVAADASARGSHQEALSALTTALDESPDDPSRYVAAIDHLRALDRHETANHFASRAELR
jgi:DNA-binding SARP family transcriptional activator/tetratricopeptide (TPR) repeat protein